VWLSLREVSSSIPSSGVLGTADDQTMRSRKLPSRIFSKLTPIRLSDFPGSTIDFSSNAGTARMHLPFSTIHATECHI
jgi:hypothetical protein